MTEMKRTQYGIDLDETCGHELCNCIKKAIEKKLLPAVYDQGYTEGEVTILSAIDSIIASYKQASAKGIPDERFVQVITAKLASYIAASTQAGPGVEVKELTSKKEPVN